MYIMVEEGTDNKMGKRGRQMIHRLIEIREVVSTTGSEREVGERGREMVNRLIKIIPKCDVAEE